MKSQKLPLSGCQIVAVNFGDSLEEESGGGFVSIMEACEKGHKSTFVNKTRQDIMFFLPIVKFKKHLGPGDSESVILIFPIEET
jgi:hypothetical protein